MTSPECIRAVLLTGHVRLRVVHVYKSSSDRVEILVNFTTKGFAQFLYYSDRIMLYHSADRSTFILCDQYNGVNARPVNAGVDLPT